MKKNTKPSKKRKDDDVSYEINNVYCQLGENKAYMSISWNGAESKDEVRRVWKDKNGEMRVGKGIEITDDDIIALNECRKKKPKAPKPVDFDAVFEASEGITEKRAMGLKTEDGFIVLRKR